MPLQRSDHRSLSTKVHTSRKFCLGTMTPQRNFSETGIIDEGFAMKQNRVRDYVIFTIFTKITPGLCQDYTKITSRLHLVFTDRLLKITDFYWRQITKIDY